MIRMLDILLAAIGLVLAAPVILVCVILIRATSPGPGLFRQVRVGQGRRPFVCLKLRTMRDDAPSAASHEVARSAITPLGRWLRHSKIDELPQLWNVLVGEMSLVGPRPCLPVQADLVEARDRLGVYRLRPGVTGPAQIAGVDMSEPLRLAAIDAEWLTARSVGRYARLILLTALGRGLGADRVR
jgi:O-antigen biosynthesis protein WbqP